MFNIRQHYARILYITAKTRLKSRRIGDAEKQFKTDFHQYGPKILGLLSRNFNFEGTGYPYCIDITPFAILNIAPSLKCRVNVSVKATLLLRTQHSICHPGFVYRHIPRSQATAQDGLLRIPLGKQGRILVCCIPLNILREHGRRLLSGQSRDYTSSCMR